MKKINLILLIVVILIIGGAIYLTYKNNTIKENNKKIIENIKNSYSKYVVTTKKTNLYDKTGNIVGKINKNVKIELKKRKINNINDAKFELKEFSGNYISYKDIKKIDKLNDIDSYYKKYIVFNENIKSNDKITFYDDNFNLLYEVKGDFNLPIYIKEKDYYGVEYNNRLLYVKKSEVEVISNHNTDLKNAKDVPILLYHFFHTHNRYESWKTVISIRIDKFEEQLKYLKENNYMTLKMKDLENYVDGKIQIPENSVVLTIDDANETFFTLAKPIIEKYDVNVAVFAISSWNPNYMSLATKNIEIHSHTHNMHQTGKCKGGQGGLFKCINYDDGLKDLKQSRKILNNTTYLAYPFGEYTDLSLKLLNDAGFSMALTTNYGNAKVGDNKLLLPRKYIYNEFTLNTFKKIIK